MANPTPFSDAIYEAARGDIVIRCTKAGGHTMVAYGQYAWSEGEEKSLFDDSLPSGLKVGLSYATAKTMITDTTYELAQCLIAGDFVLVEDRKPDDTALQEALNG